MLELLSAGGRAQFRTLLSAIIVFATGFLAAPNLNRTVALGVAVLIALVAFGIRALQAYAPTFSLTKWLGHPFGDWADSFLQGFIGSLTVTLIGILGAPDLALGRSVLVAAIVGAVNAGVRAAQGLLTPGEHPSPAVGVASPQMPYTYAAPPNG